MARVFPEWSPPADLDASPIEVAGARAERRMYSALQGSLGPEVTVIAGVTLMERKGSIIKPLELDALVLKPGWPALVLECKSNKSALPTARTADIQKQLEDRQRGVGRVLASLPGIAPECKEDLAKRGVAAALVLPNGSARAVVAGNEYFASHERVVVGKAALNDPDKLADALQGAIDHWRDEMRVSALDEQTVERLVYELAPSWRASPLRGVTADVLEAQEMLTDDQLRAMEQIVLDRRVVVTGGAGSGKTTVACHRIKGLVAAHRKVLVLCLGRPLANWYERGLSESVDVRTFDELRRELGGEPVVRSVVDATLQSEFEGPPPESPRALALYDAVVVDEAQDVNPRRLEELERLLVEPTRGEIVLLWDEHQRLFTEKTRWPEGYSRVVLARNLRNTRDIHEIAVAYRSPKGWEPPVVEGPAIGVEVIDPENDGFAETLDAVVTEIRRDSGLTAGEIVVLLAGHTDRLRDKLRGRQMLGGARVLDDAAQWRPGGEMLLVDTVRRFRGLEAPVVIVAGLAELFDGDEAWIDDSLYVALTRARAWAVLAGDARAIGQVRERLSGLAAPLDSWVCAACGEAAFSPTDSPNPDFCNRCGARSLAPVSGGNDSHSQLAIERTRSSPAVLASDGVEITPGSGAEIEVAGLRCTRVLGVTHGVAGRTAAAAYLLGDLPPLDSKVGGGVLADPAACGALEELFDWKLEPSGSASRWRLADARSRDQQAQKRRAELARLPAALAESLGAVLTDAGAHGIATAVVVFEAAVPEIHIEDIETVCEVLSHATGPRVVTDGVVVSGPIPVASRLAADHGRGLYVVVEPRVPEVGR